MKSIVGFDEQIEEGKKLAQNQAIGMKTRGKDDDYVIKALSEEALKRAALLNMDGNSLRGFLSDAAFLQGYADIVRDLKYSLTTWDPNELSIDWKW